VSELAEAAVRYAEFGWPIFPIRPIVNGRCECGGVRCAGKHPASSGWERTIAPSPKAAELMWREELGPRGIGLLCGTVCWALDVDPRHGGDVTWRDLRLQHSDDDIPLSLWSRTGGGGEHWLFAAATDIPSRADVAPGLDVRGAGGFIVLPPSPHVSGGYQWLFGPNDEQLRPAPGWLLELVRQPARRHQRNGQSWEEPPLVPPGQRHRQLVSFVGALRAMGLGEAALVECGMAFLRHHCEDPPEDPIDYMHAERSIRSISHYPPYPSSHVSRRG
jgi:Bifunctional DNA primase/polymerase, N-terminal